jgi:hypothetical protein
VDPLGLVSRRVGTGEGCSVTVWPLQVAAPPAPLTHSSVGGSITERLSPAGGDRWRHRTEEEPDGLRPYVAGDELRKIHWTASSRGRGLLVRSTSPVGRPMPLVVVDDRASSHTEDSFELALVAAASILGRVGDPRPLTRLRLLSDPEVHTGRAALDALAAAKPWQDPPELVEWPDDSDVVIAGPVADLAAHGIGRGRPRVLRVDPSERAVPAGDAVSDLESLVHWPDLAHALHEPAIRSGARR